MRVYICILELNAKAEDDEQLKTQWQDILQTLASAGNNLQGFMKKWLRECFYLRFPFEYSLKFMHL